MTCIHCIRHSQVNKISAITSSFILYFTICLHAQNCVPFQSIRITIMNTLKIPNTVLTFLLLKHLNNERYKCPRYLSTHSSMWLSTRTTLSTVFLNCIKLICINIVYSILTTQVIKMLLSHFYSTLTTLYYWLQSMYTATVHELHISPPSQKRQKTQSNAQTYKQVYVYV